MVTALRKAPRDCPVYRIRPLRARVPGGVDGPSVFGPAITSQDQGLFAQLQQNNIPTYDLQQRIEELRYGMVKSDAMRSLIFLVLGFVPLLVCVRSGKSKVLAISAVGVLVLADLYSADKRYVAHSNFAATDLYAQTYFDPFAPDDIDKAILSDTAMSYRVMDVPGFGSATRSYHHKMIGGYHAAKLNRYEDLIQRRMQHVLGEPDICLNRDDSVANQYDGENRQIIEELRADYRVLDMLNTKYVITGDTERPVMINPNALGNAWLVDEVKFLQGADAEMAALGSIDPAHQAVADEKFLVALGNDPITRVPGDTICLTAYTPNKLTYAVDTKKGGVGVFSEVYFPWGWKAEIDGTPAPIARVNYVLRACVSPPVHCDHDIRSGVNPHHLSRGLCLRVADLSPPARRNICKCTAGNKEKLVIIHNS